MTTSSATTSIASAFTLFQRVCADITARLKARNTLLWIVTGEERRTENAIIDAAAAANFRTVFWDCASGLTGTDAATGKPSTLLTMPDGGDPDNVLRYVQNTTSERRVYVLRDLHKWLASPITLRALKNRALELQSRAPSSAGAIVVLAPTAEVPPELREIARVITFPIPDRAEMAKILEGFVEGLRPGSEPSREEEAAYKAWSRKSAVYKQVMADLETGRDAIVDAAVGLSRQDATNVYSHSVVTQRSLDVALIASEKKSVIEGSGVLTWFEPDARGFSGMGGYENVKGWLALREDAYSENARAFGLPAPKGLVLVGVAGCGKSLTPKCVAGQWRVPLIRIDMGALRSKYVGESEANIRKALQIVDALGRCVLWVDEMEKALGGSTGEQGDGGVSADALGAFLTWLQERKGQVFVIATANDVSKLPPELTRKGRFDEVFFVDVPTAPERAEILNVSIKSHGRSPEAIDLAFLAEKTEGFTGAELAALVPDALFAAFADGARMLKTSDLADAAEKVVPLTVTSKEKVDALRKWAKERARPASKNPSVNVAVDGGVRSLDL